MRRLTPIACALALAGCAVGPDYQRPANPLPASYPTRATSQPTADAAPADLSSPATSSLAGTSSKTAANTGARSASKTMAKAADTTMAQPAASATVDARWWALFNDATLNTLVEQALQRNADLRQALARVEQADAVAREAGGALLPQFDLGANSSNSQASTKTAVFNPSMPRLRHARGVALSTSYELDFWGRARRANEAARANLLASQYGRDALGLSVAGLVASQYLSLRAADAQLALAGQTLASRRDTARLALIRVEAGLSSPLEQYQAEAALAASQAQIAELQRGRRLAEHQLALLTGQPDLALAAGDLRQLPQPPQPPAGLPADLIEARPDIRQAEQSLIAANAGIGIAKAGYYPRLTLTGSVGSESRGLGDLFTGGAETWSLGLGLLLPVLDFGRTSARVDQATALNQQSLIAWQKALEVAYKEVRDALVSLEQDALAEGAQQQRLTQSGKALALAQARYAAGQIGLLDVLETQRSNNDAQQAWVAARQARLNAAVDLFKALGGGWQASPSGT